MNQYEKFIWVSISVCDLSMKQSLQLRTSQHLALTPQLQQSIRLLQLSTLELHQELETMLVENPLLERLDDPLANSVRLLADGAISTPSGPTEAPLNSSEQANSASDSNTSTAAAETELAGDETSGMSLQQQEWDWTASGSGSGGDDEDGRPQIAAPAADLASHLLEQNRLNSRNHRDQALISILIDALDRHGYLAEELSDIYASLPLELCIEEQELLSALRQLQNFDPPGVGARNLAECLDLQILRMPDIPYIRRRQARKLVQEMLPLLAQKDYSKLKKQLDCDDEDLRELQAIIKRCQPRPGAGFGNEEADYVIPDVIVQKQAEQWQVLLNQDVVPKLRINQMSSLLMKQHRGEGDLAGQLQEARWLIKNMRQRFDTILRVAQAIVERQKNFFTHGEVAMRPLVLREIADTLGLHESTISRVTTQKYMLTPHGMFELKYFFGSHVATETGGEASSTAIRALIKQLIGAEDQKNPLSDSKLAEMLGEQGMVIARRTVAKYREALKIPPVSMRKSL